jgi:putative heme-binding domain-containing protein
LPSPARFSLAPGFQIDLIRLAMPAEDSWISLLFDPQGRAIISQEKQGLLRVTLGRDGSVVQSVERINADLKEVRGMAFLGRNLYVNANNSQSMYVLQGDSEGNLGRPELLLTTPGGVGHGRNDLVVGPDDKVYSIHGDDVQMLTNSRDYTQAGEVRRSDESPGQGHLIRFDPATGQVATLAKGLRNPFGIAFNSDGEIFSYDADAEFDMGSPWYRPTRVNHLTAGSDFGWRAVTGKWPPYYPDHPDNAPTSLDIGKGSPTAVCFGSRSNFPHRYRQALFILDWAYGRILAVHCLPKGASYLCEAETFLKGRPLNVTDLDFAPDGSMYFITGGRQTQSALYRVRFTGENNTDSILGSNMSGDDRSAFQLRQLRREMEALLEQTALTPAQFKQLWPAIGHADRRIRYAARIALEKQPVELWEDLALRESQRLAALTALSALMRADEAGRRARIIKRLNELDLMDASRTERQLAAWIYQVCVADHSTWEPQFVDAVRHRLEQLYPDRNYLVNEQLSLALAQLNSADFVEKTMPLLNAATDQRQQMHYLFVLRNASSGWSPGARHNYFNVLAQTRDYVGGQGMPEFLDRIRQEALAAISDEAERRRLAALHVPDAIESDESPSRALVRQWNVDELLAELQTQTDKPDVQRGRRLFAAASCSRCHRAGTTGTLIGPDLTSASRRFGRRDLLESIVEPSKVIADNYRSLQIVTRDGKTYVGRPMAGGDYRSQILRLATDPQHPLQSIEIEKTMIERQQHSEVSWMPQGLLDTFSADEIRDLLAFIESPGN